jgi:hypothetical protein
VRGRVQPPPLPGPGRGLGPLSQWAPRSGPLPRTGRSRRRAAAAEAVRDVPRLGPVSPAPAGPRGWRGVPGRKPGTRCWRQILTRHPPAHQVPSPIAIAPPAPAERCATVPRLRARAQRSAGSRFVPGGRARGARLTLLLGSMAALRWWLWQLRVRRRRQAGGWRSPAQALLGSRDPD